MISFRRTGRRIRLFWRTWGRRCGGLSRTLTHPRRLLSSTTSPDSSSPSLLWRTLLKQVRAQIEKKNLIRFRFHLQFLADTGPAALAPCPVASATKLSFSVSTRPAWWSSPPNTSSDCLPPPTDAGLCDPWCRSLMSSLSCHTTSDCSCRTTTTCRALSLHFECSAFLGKLQELILCKH